MGRSDLIERLAAWISLNPETVQAIASAVPVNWQADYIALEFGLDGPGDDIEVVTEETLRHAQWLCFQRKSRR
jgi:hypothetical protein